MAVVTAGSGCGKSTLAAQVAASADSTPVHIRLHRADVTAHDLLSATREGLQRADLASAAGVLAATEPEPSGLPDAVHDGFGEVDTPCLLLIDDAHLLDDEAARLVTAAVAELPSPHGAFISTRWLQSPLGSLAADATAAVIDAGALAFTAAEIVTLGAASGLDLSPFDGEALHRATGGWAAAVQLLLVGLRGAEDLPAAVDAACTRPSAIATLTASMMAHLDAAQRDLLTQVAHLPLLDGPLVDELAGQPGALAGARAGESGALGRLAVAGVPLTPSRDAWWTVTVPVREQLRITTPLSQRTAQLAADAYERREEHEAALQVLLRAGSDEEAVARAGSWPNHVAMRLGTEPFLQLCGAVSDDALGRDVRVLIHLSRACELANDAEGRMAALDRAAALDPDPPLRDELEAERVLAEQWLGRIEETRGRVEALLQRHDVEQPVVRAKALMAMARLESWDRRAASFQRADALLAEAFGLWEALEETAFQAQTALLRGLLVAWPLGRHRQAVAHLDTCLARSRISSRQRAQALSFKAFVLTDAGQHEEAERCLDEAAHLGNRLGDATVQRYTSWGRARVASHRGDADGTAAALGQALSDAGPSLPGAAASADLLADGAQLLDRVHRTDAAWAWLARAEQADDGVLGLVPLAAFALHARHGDPTAVTDLLTEARARPSVVPRDEWRVTLLCAEAARRRGEEREAAQLARRAFELARTTDVPDAPFIRERALAERFAAHAPAEVTSADTGFAVRLFDGFEVRRGGWDVTPPPGRLTTLVKVIAVRGGQATVEQVVTDMWPDSSLPTGRTRLRQILARLRREVGDLVVRDGATLRLADGSSVDHADFVASATGALTSRGTDLEALRHALGLSGTLLGEDTVEEWALEPRLEMQRLRAALLGRLTDDAADSLDRDEAVRAREIVEAFGGTNARPAHGSGTAHSH